VQSLANKEVHFRSSSAADKLFSYYEKRYSEKLLTMNIQPKRGHQSDHRSELCILQFSLIAIRQKNII
jgi:hypothetical protein